MGRKAGHHGGSWKVAFADFMTAMFALFLLLWLVGLSPEKKEGIETYFKTYSIFKNLSGFMTGQTSVMPNPPKDQGTKTETPGKSKEKPDNQKVMAQLRDKIAVELKEKADQVTIEEVNGKIKIELTDKDNKPLFESGSTQMTETAKNALNVIAKMMIDNNYKATIEGHTDSKRFRSSYYTNWELSTERALETRKYLESKGYAEENVVSVTGYAATKPLLKDNPENSKNRRISLFLEWSENSVHTVPKTENNNVVSPAGINETQEIPNETLNEQSNETTHEAEH